ncbi:esterase-like activity of phytase family protein [Legionella brunensis]|uniref:Phytase-like domain-containing protein n=1 Tax=Legionella brunensis TaxID=29422 RepID=A0A0W0SNL2_9GAMM|nr:esterase-like activity of phytase family protein [Legionella brunensis]KTC84952.1 hypothetical protein Lbru_1167 [Legionella brunensis]
MKINKVISVLLCSVLLQIINSSLCNASTELKLSADKVIKIPLKNPDILDKTQVQQSIAIGGFSGLRFLQQDSKGKLLFLTHTDRGPNTEPYIRDKIVHRPFMLPNFTPRLVFLEADVITKTMTIKKQIQLKDPKGKLLTGLPRERLHEHPVNLHGKVLAFDKWGMDLEGIDIAKDGSYWMVEEYGPSIVHFSSQGKLINLFQPGEGLPVYIKRRKLNRGFEGIALENRKVFAILQSPIRNSKVLPIVEFDMDNKKTTAQYSYQLDGQDARIGDMVAVGSKRFLVIEQNKKSKKIFLIHLNHVRKNKLVYKQELINLTSLGINAKKIEGITLVGQKHIAVITDNDFGLAGVLDQKTGRAKFNKEKSVLYIITLPRKLQE